MAEGVENTRLSLHEEALLEQLRGAEPALSASVGRRIPLAERVADIVAAEVGSWRFVILQTIFFAIWILLNVITWFSAWDPYPFLLLDLLLSFQAAYIAPIILMSENRQAVVDRYRAESEYEINLQAALEIKLLHQKIDAIRESEVVEIRRILAHIENRLGKSAEFDDRHGEPNATS